MLTTDVCILWVHEVHTSRLLNSAEIVMVRETNVIRLDWWVR